MRIKETKRDVK